MHAWIMHGIKLNIVFFIAIYFWVMLPPLNTAVECCDRMVVGFTTTCAMMPTTTNVVSLNPVHGEVYSIQHYEVYLNFPINQEIEN
jgi:uncharacterized membrane protein YccF (DUF307 family)